MSVNYGKNLISYMQRHFVNKSNTVLTISFNFSDDIPYVNYEPFGLYEFVN